MSAVIEAGRTRLRPVLMTALAMIIGMIPMALGLGEAGEQNAPLGRAVIGGLIVATIATLFIVPIFYTLLRRKPPSLHMLDTRFAAEAAGAYNRGLRMARRGRFGSFLVYLIGIVALAARPSAACACGEQGCATRVQPARRSPRASRRVRRCRWHNNPGTEGAADHAARRYQALSGRDALRQSQRLRQLDSRGSRRPRKGRRRAGSGRFGRDRSAIRRRPQRHGEQERN